MTTMMTTTRTAEASVASFLFAPYPKCLYKFASARHLKLDFVIGVWPIVDWL